ncbi:unnamed protein product [Meganyctiphanes norvegica]|uniref:Pentraxin (PTX) domain-containing protein n=1 Tax=Meganyctiphanes norvegica TaxID=48144 RepID=A0AAV2QGV5_MEGNR
MILQRAFIVAGFLVFIVPEGSLSQNALEFARPSVQSCNKPSYVSKVHLKQEDYTQSIHYMASVPELTKGFTTHFWLNLHNVNRNATVLSYALGLHQLDTLVLKYVGGGTMPLWELTLNGTVVFRQPVKPLIQGQWHHITTTWATSTDLWTLFQDGDVVAEGKSLQEVNRAVPGGGTVVVGAFQKTLVNGADDQEEAVEGWITYFYLHSQPIGIYEYFQKVWTRRCSSDMAAFNDIIDWVHTPHKLVGGVKEVKASSSCGSF